MINKLNSIRKEFIDSTSDKVASMTSSQTYFISNVVSCLSMAIDYYLAYEKTNENNTTANDTKES